MGMEASVETLQQAIDYSSSNLSSLCVLDLLETGICVDLSHLNLYSIIAH
jgi:hypothetical protein